MPRIPDDPTIYVGLRLYDGTDYDTIIERVEYGGFGVIAFGPNRLRDGRMTVYKSLRRDLLKDPLTRASFVRECLLWVGLWAHANVELAYGAFEMGDAVGQRPFLALEYAENGSLRELLRRAEREPDGHLPLGFALFLAQQIAAGLAYLHQPDPAYLRAEPTVHRDLKPENVLITDNGRAVITDFGLAKAVEESPMAVALLLARSSGYGQRELGGQAGQGGSALAPERQAEEAILIGGEEATQTMGLHTARGAALGTVAYMAPEQWDDARYAGTPADLYAFGIMLSEIFAGRHALLDLSQPHTKDAWRAAHLHPQPRPLREIAPNVPPVVEALYQRCLAANPADRPSAAETLAVLQAGARAAGEDLYTAPEVAQHIPYNEWVHWHMWAIAYDSFELDHEALARNDRALALARRLVGERADLLAKTLLTRGNILTGLGTQALRAGKAAEAAGFDQQVEAAYQESLAAREPANTVEGQRGRAVVWNQIGVFNNVRERYAYAEDAYGRALALKPDKASTYFNRALNQAQWAAAEEHAGRLDATIAHLRQARVFAVTSLGMNYPPAAGLLEDIEKILHELGVAE